MGIRENKVEKYLDERFTELGGGTRKWVSPGRDGVPDRIVSHGSFKPVFVEVKTNDGVLEQHQINEQWRLNEIGLTVTTVFGESGVESFITDYFLRKHICKEYR